MHIVQRIERVETFKKVVINPNYGWFCLSNKAIYYYLFLKYGKKFYPYVQYDDYYDIDCDFDFLVCIDYKTAFDSVGYVEWLPFSVPDFPRRSRMPKNNPLWSCQWPDNLIKTQEEIYNLYNANREDMHLIKVIETLGKEAHIDRTGFKIIEIPSVVCYYIDDDRGKETIHEVHRTWS